MGGSSNSVNQSSFLSGGLAGAVGRQFTQSAMQTMTGHASNPISRRAFESSVKKGGDFANGVTGAVAKGNISYTGSMTGSQAAQALTSYLGQTGIPDAPSYSGVEIGGGRITGTETSVDYPNGTAFGILVRILSVKIRSLEDISVKADVKSVNGNTSKENLSKCKIQGKYAGTVTDIHKGTVFVRLHIGVNAVAHSCYDNRMPGKKDDVSFVVTRIDADRNVAVGLISRIIKQNI